MKPWFQWFLIAILALFAPTLVLAQDDDSEAEDSDDDDSDDDDSDGSGATEFEGDRLYIVGDDLPGDEDDGPEIDPSTLAKRTLNAEEIHNLIPIRIGFWVVYRDSALHPGGGTAEGIWEAYDYGTLGGVALGGEAAYRLFPWLDVGTSVGWGTFAANNDLIQEGVFEFSFFGRPTLRQGAGRGVGDDTLLDFLFEPGVRLDVGLMFPSLTVRDESLANVLFFIEASVEVFVGSWLAQGLRVGYRLASWPDGLGDGTALPYGGLTIGTALDASVGGP